MMWLNEFCELAAQTDTLAGHPQHRLLLAAGLAGEVGSILAELKKSAREGAAYPTFKFRLTEELGDALWYFCRLASSCGLNPGSDFSDFDCNVKADPLGMSLRLVTSAASIVALVEMPTECPDTELSRKHFNHFWATIGELASALGVGLSEAAAFNKHKTLGRWPVSRDYYSLFDADVPEIEQLPRVLDVEFVSVPRGTQSVVILRCNGLNFGDRLTDNIRDPDGYRFHDIFHFSYMVHLGWSPVTRSLLRTKRKSLPIVDEGEDGARAAIIEEAISALVFSRAKKAGFFADIGQLDFDLLKTIKELTTGYEVDRVPVWQWETAILDGYRVFRMLRELQGGSVRLDLLRRRLDLG